MWNDPKSWLSRSLDSVQSSTYNIICNLNIIIHFLYYQPTSADLVLEGVEHSIWITADWTDSCDDSWISGSQLDSSEDSSLHVLTVWKHDSKSYDRFFTSNPFDFNTAGDVLFSTCCIEFPWIISDSELVPEEKESFLLLGLSSSNSSMHVWFWVSKNSSDFFQTIVCLGILSSSDWVFLYSWLAFVVLFETAWSFDVFWVIFVSILDTMSEHYKTKTKYENKHFFAWCFKNKLKSHKLFIWKCKHFPDCSLSVSSEETPNDNSHKLSKTTRKLQMSNLNLKYKNRMLWVKITRTKQIQSQACL